VAIEIEYDPAKDVVNKRKHEFPLEAGALVIERAVELVMDESAEEPRWQAYAWVNGRAMMCVYALRPESTHRIIFSKGNKEENCTVARTVRMTVTPERAKEIIDSIDWDRIDAMTDEDIKRQIAENPDAAPLPSKMRLVWRMKSSRLSTKYKVRLLRRALKMTRAEFATAFGIPERTLQHWEQGTREPDEASLSYLAVIAEIPERVRRVHVGRRKSA
jgi:putative transcriptional regulator